MPTRPHRDTVRLAALGLILAAGAVSATTLDAGPVDPPGSDVVVRNHLARDGAESPLGVPVRPAADGVTASPTLPEQPLPR